MRVLAVSNRYPPLYSGGYELICEAAMLHLTRGGHAVRVLTSDYGLGEAGAEGGGEPEVFRELREQREPTARRLPERFAKERTNRRALQRQLEAFKPDVVSWWNLGTLSSSMLEIVRDAGLPAVGYVADDWLTHVPRSRSAASKLLFRAVGMPAEVDPDTAAHWIFISETTRRTARKAGYRLPESSVAPAGVDTAVFTRRDPGPWDWRLLYAGRLDPRKGIDTALAALAELPDARLRIVGDGDEGEREALEAQALRLGVLERVDFGASVEHRALAEAYAESDAVLFPVKWEEPWGLVPLEAMAVGRPVVATGTGGSGEYLADEENCLLFPAGSASELADRVRRLGSDPGLVARLREGGFETASRYTSDNCSVQVGTILKTVGAPRARP